MRKIILVLLPLLLILNNLAYAENINLEAMSFEDLVELHNMVDAEIDARISCNESIIPMGLYIAGKSIKAGSYTLSGNDKHYGAEIATYASKELYDQAISEDDESLILYECYVSNGESAFVNLEDGMVLVVEDASLVIEQAKADWML